MKVHSPWVGVYGPSLIFRYWGFFVPPVDFVVPQVEAPSGYCVNSLHTLVLMEHWFSLACLQCSYPNGA